MIPSSHIALKGMQPQSENNNRCKFKSKQEQHFPKKPTTRNTTARTTESASTIQQNPIQAAAAGTAHELAKRSSTVKIIKCKKPLCQFKFYLDICDHQLTKRIEDQIKLLGGTLEFFLTPSVTHFVTDKQIVTSAVASIHCNSNNSYNLDISCPETPQTPQTPHTPHSLECLPDFKTNNGLVNKKPIRNSRADAILKKARGQTTANVSTPTKNYILCQGFTVKPTGCDTLLKNKSKLGNHGTDSEPFTYVVWQCEIALKFFKKIQHELKDYLDHSNKSKNKSYATEPIVLKGGFVKFESLKRNFRPYYHLFRKPQEWPKIELSREDGAFRLSPKKILPLKEIEEFGKVSQTLGGGALIDNMTRKSRTKSSQNHNNLKNKGNDILKSPANSQKQLAKCKDQTPQHQKDSSDKQCGVCEICKIEYDALTIHLKTKDHEYFAKNSQNFMALDSLIHSSADVNKFLDENRRLEIKTELEEMEVDHEGLISIEQDPLQNSENENQNDDGDNDAEEYDDGEESQKSSSTNKRKSVESKIFSPTLREKSKRSTKGKHSSEKFQNCALTKLRIPSPQKTLSAFDVRTSITRKKPSSTAISPPMRAILPTNSMYKVVETHAEVNCISSRGKGLPHGLNDESKNAGSPIIVKFKKVRTTELQVLNGEAENFMFPKKRCDSSELPTDIDRHTTSDRMQHTQSSQQILTSSSSCEEQELDEDYGINDRALQAGHNSKKSILKAKRRLSKLSSSSMSKSTKGGKFKQSFPKTPIQPIEQLKSVTKSTTAITNTTTRKSLPASQNKTANAQSVTTAMAVSKKIVLPEATRKSSRTATAIVTAATTSTRLLQAAVEAAKNKQKLETSSKCKLPLPSIALAKQSQPTKKIKIKQELNSDSECEYRLDIDDSRIFFNEAPHSKKLRCSRKSVVKVEDRMGEKNKKPQNSEKKGKFIHSDYFDDDDDITIDDDDEKDEDFIVQSFKGKTKLTSKPTKKCSFKVSCCSSAAQKTSVTSKLSTKSKRSAKKFQRNTTVREERLARRQSRIITQLQLELQTASEEEHVKEFPKPKTTEKKIERSNNEKSPSKPSVKLSKRQVSSKKSTLKIKSPIKKESSPASRYFDYTNSERLKGMQYAFERLPIGDLWYRVYKRQDNCEEKYFEYFGSTKYRKLPYELGPIPFDSTLSDTGKHDTCCRLCESERLKTESGVAKKLHVRRDLQLDLNSEHNASHKNIQHFESQEYNNTSSPFHHNNQQNEESNGDHGRDQEHSKLICSSYSTETKSYAHKHKKLHLLQRYQQEVEQQELLQRQKLENEIKSNQLMTENCKIKMEDLTQECLPARSDRAGSDHSNTSSCASSTHTNCKSKKMRNKLLNKVSFLSNLELPPRKSPREHASTLALVSCIIKQRQDSLSKPNSETDEPSTTPIEPASKVLEMAAEQLSACEVLETKPKTTPPLSRKTSAESPTPNVINSPRTRSHATTPIEEVRFATEISETVKRMRRGRNKYDHSPPFVQRRVARPISARGRGRGGASSIVNLLGQKSKTTVASLVSSQSHTTSTNLQTHRKGNTVTRGHRRRGRQKGYNNMPKNHENVLTSIRKTGSKKGVLEFDVDNIAIDALKKATTDYVNPKLLEWQIDKFLILENEEFDKDLTLVLDNITIPSVGNIEGEGDAESLDNVIPVISNITPNTPPATDYFSSDFDLCDILNQNCDRLKDEDDNASYPSHRSKKFSIFNTVLLNKYYRKRKNPKSNRTGWPKAPKKKTVTRQQLTKDKIYFLQNGGLREDNCGNKITFKKELLDENIPADGDESTQDHTRESIVITPPDSEREIDDSAKHNKMSIEEDGESLLMEEDSRMAPIEDSLTIHEGDEDEICNGNADHEEERGRIIEEDVVLANSIDNDDNDEEEDDDDDDEDEEEHRLQKAGSDADADIEEADEDYECGTRRDKIQQKCTEFTKKVNKKCKRIIPKIIENDDEDSYEPQEKRQCSFQGSPVEKIRTSHLNLNYAPTSTHTTPFVRSLRRTPQLNGSLGSCLSPSEKAGDNSDIFTVSSDGLDTDMDLSNSHCQLRSAATVVIDEDDHRHHTHYNTSLHNNSTIAPRKKFDISKYAPSNATTCAAEAATAAVKSMAISQFLKKEVRVTCRRLRAPFRRFRYRR